MKAKAEAIKSTHRSFIAYAYESNEFEHPSIFIMRRKLSLLRKEKGM
ncbi:hypothetical protein JCM19239_7339 [Vibrio variabilis]|uniref:Uncharacterized protein n=1 Tax=Vibrio variabilis TaxID=990271 RepID=A0ABQ0J7I6_9VIBR|nr:hypothetical protein JCM19239_7339 [Vibrio variabilis]